MNRGIWIAGLGSALAVPYLTLDGNVPTWMERQRSSWQGNASGSDDHASFNHSGSQPASAGHSGGHEFTAHGSVQEPSAPITPLAEILRWEISPEWVIQRWPRVDTTVGNEQFSAMRVPVVTGFAPYDLAGSLTYSFDRYRRLQRIMLQGSTGDERPLVMQTVPAFGMRPEPALGASVFAARTKKHIATSVLRIDYAPIVSSDAPNQGRRFWLELNRTGGATLSEESLRMFDPPAGMAAK